MQEFFAKFRAALVKLGEKGQNSLEYIGLAIIAGLIIVAIATALGPAKTALTDKITDITGVTLGGPAPDAGDQPA